MGCRLASQDVRPILWQVDCFLPLLIIQRSFNPFPSSFLISWYRRVIRNGLFYIRTVALCSVHSIEFAIDMKLANASRTKVLACRTPDGRLGRLLTVKTFVRAILSMVIQAAYANLVPTFQFIFKDILFI